MSLSIYNCVCIVLAFWLFRICLRSVLALRFHFRFGRLGFFSINNIQYHHHRSSENALWSAKIGKLKIRLRRTPTLSSPTPFITIYIADIQIQLHSLVALAAAARRHKQKVAQSKLNRRFSRVSSSLKKIPWWYSLSIVKHVIKFTSALPAQLLMAGLANYVDVRVDNFQLEVEQQAVIKLQHLNFSSVLFANVTIPASPSTSVPNSVPTSPNESTENFHHRLSERISSLNSSYQRHSLKRAQHLFKEKFFEITVKIGKIAVVKMQDSDETMEMLSLPTGGQIAVSCHLSAGCVTLKDVDANTQVDSFKVKLSPLLDLVKSLKQPAQEESKTQHQDFDQIYQNQQDSNKKSNIIQLLRSVTFSVDNTIIETQHQEDCHSSLLLQDIHITGISETCIPGVAPYYKLQSMLGLSSWTIFNNSNQMKVITLPEVKLSVNMAQALIMPGNKSNSEDLSLLENGNISSSDLKPNQKFIDITLTIDSPRLYLDVSKANMLSKLVSTSHKVKKADKHREKELNATFSNLPRASLLITVENPSIHMESLEKHMGIISWSNVVLDVSGIYCAQKNRPVSVLSRFSEPMTSTTSKDDLVEFQAESTAVQRIRSNSRPSWTNLFRRSWKSKASEDNGLKNVVEWHYKASVRINIQNTCFEDIYDINKVRPNSEKTRQYVVDGESNAFISVVNFECEAHSRLNVSFVENVTTQHVLTVWDSDSHHINVDVAVDKPVINLWTKSVVEGESQLEFWTNSIMAKIKPESRNRSSPTLDQANQQQGKTDLFGYISILKTNVSINDAAIVFEGLDKGVNGTRPVPTGFLDNAPKKDIDIRVVMSIQQISYVFNGSRIFSSTRGKHKYNLSVGSISTEGTDDEDEIAAADDNIEKKQVTFGTSRLSVQHIVVERIFKSDDSVDEVGWHHHEDRKAFILWVSRINTRTEMILEAGRRVIFIPSIVVKKNGIQYNVTNHYACLVTAISTKEMIRKCFPKKNQHSTPEATSNKNFTIHKLQLQVNRTDVHIFLPGGNAQVYLRMDSLRTQWNNGVEHQGEVPPTAIRNVTLYGVAPRNSDQWDQLLELDNMRFSIEKDVDFSTGALTKTSQLSMSKFYVRIPYGYELSNFVDGAVNLLKGAKALHARIFKGVSFLYFGPNEKKAPAVIPTMRLVCDFFTFQFEDDPFEARLRSIWKTGLSEQANRIAIQDAFEVKAQSLMKSDNDKNKMGSERGNFKNKLIFYTM